MLSSEMMVQNYKTARGHITDKRNLKYYRHQHIKSYILTSNLVPSMLRKTFYIPCKSLKVRVNVKYKARHRRQRISDKVTARVGMFSSSLSPTPQNPGYAIDCNVTRNEFLF
jgi:hypothetical protein